MTRTSPIPGVDLSQAMLRDRPVLRRQLRQAAQRQRRRQPVDRLLARIRRQFAESRDLVHARRRNRPTIAYPPDLPIADKRDDIAAALRDHPVVVVCGETGSGKSTQLPKLCLDLGRGVTGLIGHTQPRRIAARSIAARVAEELRTPLGRAVGYKVRFGDHTDDRTLIKVMTDGILLAETPHDRELLAYDTIIIDEAHERSLNIDFLLGYLRQLLERRRDLKIIITSATIDPHRFSEHFNGAPIVEVSGRTYPVEVRHRPLSSDDPDVEDRELIPAILEAADELASLDRTGDMLVFCSGEREIRDAAEALRKHHPAGTEVLPLFARLSAADQMKVFSPHPGRRIVLATNIAETSLTVPGIRYVIDTGHARVSRYNHRAKVQRLPIEPISQASAAQRAGRCGRTSDGVCIRLYSEADLQAREPFTPPQVLRSNLAGVMLQMKSLGLGTMEDFPFIDPPSRAMMTEAYRTLHELGAMDERGALTAIGRELAGLPIDVRIGRMILAAGQENCLAEVLVIAAALSVQDPRERPADREQAADEAHARFAHPDSDFLTYLNLWDFYGQQVKHLSRSKLRRACAQNFLSYVRMREWYDIHHQLKERITARQAKVNRRPASPDAIHRALLAGLLANVGLRTGKYEYTGAGGTKFHLFPGSGQFDKRPHWVMAAELVETTRLFARTIGPVQPPWIESLGEHLVKRHYAEPRWQAESAHVVADERVTLYGLVIVPRRTVPYGRIDPKASRELFIHHALVLGEYETTAPFARHNRRLQDEVAKLEDKARRHDILADEQARYAFYDARVPADVHDGPTFEKWRRAAERDNPRLLFMSNDHLLAGDAQDITAQAFPDHLAAAGTSLPLDYLAAPGDADDGVTLTVRLDALNQLDEARLSWLVPGRRRELIVELLRTLPKPIRTHFVPAGHWADACAARLTEDGRPFVAVLAELLQTLGSTPVRPEDFNPHALPDHLKMKVNVVDESGKRLAAGRDPAALRKELSDQLTEHFASITDNPLTRDGLTDWDFDELPRSIEHRRAGLTLKAYPALVDAGGSVSIRLFDSPGAAGAAHRAGLRRLFILAVSGELDYRSKNLRDFERTAVQLAPAAAPADLRDQLIALIADRAFGSDDADIRTAVDFHARLESGWNAIGPATEQVGRLVGRIGQAYHEAAMAIDGATRPAWSGAAADMRGQLKLLVAGRFLTDTPWAWLGQFPRYLRGIAARLDKLRSGKASRDADQAARLAPHWSRCVRHMTDRTDWRGDAAFVTYRWMCEEFRVSLFAQELGTAIAVSTKRLDKQWAQVRG